VSKRLHPLLTEARTSIDAYSVRRAPHGFNLWRFRRWDHAEPGWRLVDQVRTRGDAEDALLERLGLKPSSERAPVYVPAVITPCDPDPGDYYGYGR
jgi:hypothetical protein